MVDHTCLQLLLGLQGGAQGLPGGIKCHAKRIPDDLENVAVVRLHGGLQDGMMAESQSLQLVGVCLRKPGAAFDIGEEEGDGTSGGNQPWDLILAFNFIHG